MPYSLYITLRRNTKVQHCFDSAKLFCLKIKHRGEKNRPDAIILRQFKGFYRLTINGIKYRYLYQNKDFKTYLDLEDDIYNDYLKLSKEDKKLYFGSYDGGESDPNIFRRYHISRLSWKIGEPGLVLLQIHGGGYAGYVTGDTYVETDCQLGCHDIFGAGLGALPYGDFSSGSGYDFGSVKGKSMVSSKEAMSTIVSMVEVPVWSL